MSDPVGFRHQLQMSSITKEQITDLIDKADRQLAELRRMLRNNLSPTVAEMILFKIFEDIEYQHALLTGNSEVLKTFQPI